MKTFDKSKSIRYNRFILATLLYEMEIIYLQKRYAFNTLKNALSFDDAQQKAALMNKQLQLPKEGFPKYKAKDLMLTEKKINEIRDEIRQLDSLYYRRLKKVQEKYAIDSYHLNQFIKQQDKILEEDMIGYVEVNEELLKSTNAYILFWDKDIDENELQKQLTAVNHHEDIDETNDEVLEGYALCKIAQWIEFNHEWLEAMKQQFGFDLDISVKEAQELLQSMKE